MNVDRVLIVQPPVGEAPEWVRAAWVGLKLPLAHGVSVDVPTTGVLRGPKSRLGRFWAALTRATENIDGYIVNAKQAVDLLATTNPAAADWWRTNAPHVLDGRQAFMFDSAACRLHRADDPAHWSVANDPR
jgi:hypothetical protein